MAQRTITQLFCDLHDDEEVVGEETITFAFDGRDYEIDVCEEHGSELHEVMAIYTAHARRRSASGGSPAKAPTQRKARGANGYDASAVRAWAKDAGYDVADRGRIKPEIVEAFRTAGGS